MIVGLSPGSWLRRNPRHPGRHIAVRLEADEEEPEEYPGMSVAEMARKLGVSRSRLSRVCREQSPITLDLAMKLEAYGWATADAWMEMQTNYDIARERKRLNRPLTQAPAYIREQELLRAEQAEEAEAPATMAA